MQAVTAPRSHQGRVRLVGAGKGWAHIESVPIAGGGQQELERLMASIAAGGQESFASLYDLLSHRVYGLVARIVRDRAISEEVTQEVFFEIWRKAPTFDHTRGSALTWILTVAHRRAVDRVRSEERHSRRRPPQDESDFDVVSEAVEANLERRYVQKALDSLSPLQREVVVLAYYSGYTYRQVAERLDIPLGTLKSRMRDGLSRLRSALEGTQ